MTRDMTVLDLGELAQIVRDQPFPLLFATVSGAHLYGFPSRDSDVDLRGVHLLPLERVVGLHVGPETFTRSWEQDGAEMDVVTHDLAKFVRLLLRPNGYVLEQLLSPLVVASSPAHAELVALAPGLLTSRHAHHYRGFARTQWALAERTGRLKPVLYTLRALLTGVYLLRSGRVEADLTRLADLVPEAPPYLLDLVEAKRRAEHLEVSGVVPERLPDDVDRLHALLDHAETASELPPEPSVAADVEALLVRLRLGSS
jgi:predicted nucleotidyltransferase